MKDKISLEDLILLNLTGYIGSSRLNSLLERFGSTESIIKASRESLSSVRGIGAEIAKAIAELSKSDGAAEEIERAEKLGVKILPYTHPDYPQQLKNIFDYPLVLYIKGELKDADKLSIAIVGTRQATDYGKNQAFRFANELAQLGVSIVSGLARGVDTYAHNGALKAKEGRTIAVVGSGLDIVYPPENKRIFDQIAKGGAVISEFGFGVQPDARSFPRRNRIISALSLGTLVIEAGEKSGALITAHQALEQGKNVFCLPGDIDKPQSKGTNKLIRDGAKLVDNIEDVLEEIPAFSEILKSISREPILNPMEKLVFDSINSGEQDIYNIVNTTGASEESVKIALESLISRGLIKQGVIGTQSKLFVSP